MKEWIEYQQLMFCSFYVASENTGSRPNTEVKQHLAELVLGWVASWAHHVMLAFLLPDHSGRAV